MHKHADRVQPDQNKIGGEHYSKTEFTFSDNKFKTYLWAKQGDVRCPELSIYVRGYSIIIIFSMVIISTMIL